MVLLLPSAYSPGTSSQQPWARWVVARAHLSPGPCQGCSSRAFHSLPIHSSCLTSTPSREGNGHVLWEQVWERKASNRSSRPGCPFGPKLGVIWVTSLGCKNIGISRTRYLKSWPLGNWHSRSLCRWGCAFWNVSKCSCWCFGWVQDAPHHVLCFVS